VEVVIYDNGELNEMVNQRVVRTGMLFVLCAVHAGMLLPSGSADVTRWLARQLMS
jgi:hypothetical protein